MKKYYLLKVTLLLLLGEYSVAQVNRLPAYPLITHDPYFSIWSFSDEASSSETRHWTGANNPLLGLVRIDGEIYRFLGGDKDSPTPLMSAEQQWVSVNATQTRYQFVCGGVDLSLTFTSPLLLNDLSLLSRPVSYISFRLRSNDGQEHRAQLYFGVSGLVAANTPAQELVVRKKDFGALSALEAGTREQPILQKKGDNLRIDWGYCYVAAPVAQGAWQDISTREEAIRTFVKED